MSRSLRVCFFGDSFVAGTGDDDCLGWVGRVAADARRGGCDLTAYNLGVRRDTSADIGARWRVEAEARLPVEHDGRLVFSFGSNDCAAGAGGKPRLSMPQSLDNARQILTDAVAWRAILMVGPLPLSDGGPADRRVAELSRSLALLCGEINVPYLDFLTVVGRISPVWQSEIAAGDGVHPGRAAYAALASEFGAWTAWRGWITG